MSAGGQGVCDEKIIVNSIKNATFATQIKTHTKMAVTIHTNTVSADTHGNKFSVSTEQNFRLDARKFLSRRSKIFIETQQMLRRDRK